MASWLYNVGRMSFQHRRRVLLSWLLALIVLGGAAALISKPFEEQLSVPGTESQAALDQLQRTFPQVASTSAEVIVVLGDQATFNDPEVRQAITEWGDGVAEIPGVEGLTTPYADLVDGLLAADASAGLVRIQLEGSVADVSDERRDQLVEAASQLQAELPGSEVSAGGEAFHANIPKLSPIELIGLAVALVVLLITLGSFRAAGMPIITALVGVSVSMALIIATTALTTISSTTPMLALMLGLAVGIDYALFIVSRHREELSSGVEPIEAAARSIATAGSAVVFAGATVIIALVGLAVAGIPFLAVMGIAAAVAVAVAVLIALTLTPALLGFAGAALTPKSARRAASATTATTRNWATRWVAAVTKVPLLTVLVVIVVLGALSLPARDLQLALPNAGEAEHGTPARTTFDLISDQFGPGYNGPLVMTGQIITSTDPLGLIDDLKAEIEQVPGVASVPLATPNPNADTAFIQIVPTTGPQSAQTTELVQRLRESAPRWRDTYGVDLKVTGYTAVAIDISQLLQRALLPFGIFVIGLSLVLLTLVFRSILVPLKASIGFLLSVGTAFGLTTLVFNQGLGGWLVNLESPRPVISFMPIIVMGVLFGLAMDYQVFLVARIREQVTHGQAARAAIAAGFTSSAPVVVAAAVIMFAVFVFFVPAGDGPIKAIAFGLAVGVFVDAFIVRMTLVPAVLQLLGRWAWWLPAWLERRLPRLDVEGEALRRRQELADWPYPGADHVVYTEALQVDGLSKPLAIDLRPGQTLLLTGPDDRRRAVLLALTGRLTSQGPARVAGRVLEDEAAAVRSAAVWLDEAVLSRSMRGQSMRGQSMRAARLAQAPLLVIDDGEQIASVAALSQLARHRYESGVGAMIISARNLDSLAAIADALPGASFTVDLSDWPQSATSDHDHRLAPVNGKEYVDA